MLEGIVSETHFANLMNLKSLYADNNPLIFKVSPKWIPPFQLYEIYLRSCHLGPQFPSWLQSQNKLSWLDLGLLPYQFVVIQAMWFLLLRPISFIDPYLFYSF